MAAAATIDVDVGDELGSPDGPQALHVSFDAVVARHLAELQRRLVLEHERRLSYEMKKERTLQREKTKQDIFDPGAPVGLNDPSFLSGSKATEDANERSPANAEPFALELVARSEAYPDGETQHSSADSFELWTGWKDEISTGVLKLSNSLKDDMDAPLQRGLSRMASRSSLDDDLDRVVDYVGGRCIADPNARSRLVWDITGIFMLMYDLVLIPLALAFQLESSLVIDVMSLITLIYWILDIPASCITGYFAVDGTLVTAPAKIWRRYATTWFGMDVIVVSIDLYTLAMAGQREAAGVMRAGRMLRMLRVLRTLRLLRLAKLRHLVLVIQDNMDSEYTSTVFNILKYIIVIIIINHYVACGWYWLGRSMSTHDPDSSWVRSEGLDQRSSSYQYLTSVHWSLTQFTPASIDVQPRNETERLYAIFVLLFALCVFSSFLGSISAAMTHLRNITFNYDKQMWLLRKYLREQGVSRKLVVRIHTYVTVIATMRSKRVPANRVELLSYLSEPLREVLQTDMFKPKLVIHGFFALLKDSVLAKICSDAVGQESLSRDDVLFTAGSAADSMFFISTGLLQYESHVGKRKKDEVPAGRCFSEAVLWTQWMHLGRMMSMRESDLVKLNAASFRHIVLEFPVHSSVARTYGAIFLRNLNERFHQHTISDLHFDLTAEIQCEMQDMIARLKAEE
jgi:hypothetical protein